MAKVNQLNKELRDMSIEQLASRLDDYRRDLFQLRLSSVTSHIKDVSAFRKLRKNIARAKFVLDQKLNEKSN